MKLKEPKNLTKGKFRKIMWKNAAKALEKIGEVLPISSAYLVGSFSTKKQRPADVDCIILLKTKELENSKWSLDLVIAPENKFGQEVVEDTRKWMTEKYGQNKYEFIKLK